MKLLKGLVVFMGILVVAGMAVLAYGIYMKATDPDFTFFAGKPEKQEKSASFGDVAFPLPADCNILETIPEGDRLYLRIGPVGPCERIVVISADDGSVIGTIWVKR
ncbi:MAG: hypothetical protein IIC04_02340 [Proteobacteria bacterium]|nr:hypothetical protein [Pseudomonadota bacterium]